MESPARTVQKIVVPHLIRIMLADLVIQAYNSAILIFSISA
jgi:hypothetical protein